MATKITNAASSAMADALTTAIGASGRCKIYSGSAPATADTAASGTLLVNAALSATAFGAGSNGVITLAGTPITTAASATGTAGYFRLTTSGGTTVLQGDVGTSGAELILNTLAIVNGVNVTITAGTVTMPVS